MVDDRTRAAEELFETGLRLRKLHQWKKAAMVFNQVTVMKPDWSEAWFWEAVSLDNRGNEREAIPCYLRAIQSGLKGDLLGKALTWLASSYSKTDELEDASRYLNEAITHGGYEPQDEFLGIAKEIERRILRLSRK